MQSNIQTDLPADAMQVNWRPKDITHAIQYCNTELREKLCVVQDEHGIPKQASLQGILGLECLMSGNPEITLQFSQLNLILDASLARNVQIAAWNRDRTFRVMDPQDGKHCVCCYKAQVDMNMVPLNIRVDQQLKNGEKLFIVSIQQLEQLVKGVYGLPVVQCIQVTIPLTDYMMQHVETQDGTTQLNLADADRWVMWNVTLNKNGMAKLVMKLDARKQGHIPRIPIAKLQYYISDYLISGLTLLPTVFVNSTG
jgi:hypothetical protein